MMPALLFTAGISGLWVWIRHYKKGKLLTASLFCFILAIIFFAVRIYATHIEPHRLILKELTIESAKVDKPIRILHISDIQSNSVGKYEEKVFRRIREINPDLILFTGDLIQTRDVDIEFPKIVNLLRTLNPPYGMYGIFGDTDWRIHGYSDYGGLKMLESENAEIFLGNTKISIYGLSVEQSRDDNYELVNKWLDDSPGFSIVLGHSPDYILSIMELPVDLCLAGHTHGGQIVVPFFGPIVTLSSVPRKWASGFNEVGNTRLNVSAGIGSEHAAGLPSIRINCPSEMTLITLEPSNSRD